MRLHFFIRIIITGLVVHIVAWFQDEGLDVLVLHITKCEFIKVAVMYIEENYFIVDSGGTAYGGELGRVFKPPVSIHIHRCYVVEYPVQWDIEVEILGLLLCLLHNDVRNESFPIGSVENN